MTDIQMPGMTGIELHRRLIDAGYAIPTILVTAYPDEAARDRALKDGCFVTSASRWMMTISRGAFVRLSNREAARIDSWVYSAAGRVNRNTAPRGSLWSTHKRPPCATMMERQIASPIPSPLVFVV